jgi:hypothetical protein
VIELKPLQKKFACFLKRNSQSLHWVMFFLVFQEIVGGFFAQEGYLRITSSQTEQCSVLALKCISLLIAFRLLRPRGGQDILLLLAATIVPCSTDFWPGRSYLLTLLVLFGRWHRFTRIAGVVLIVLFSTIWYKSLNLLEGCNPVAYKEMWPAKGRFISSTDNIYNVYFFMDCFGSPHYALFREIKLTPGVELVKRLYIYSKDRRPVVMRDPDGNYMVVGGKAFF